MSFFDIGVAAVVAFCLVRGAFRGLIGEVAGIIGVVAGFYGANTYYLQISPYLETWVASQGGRRLICFFVLFCLILVLVGLLARLIRKLLRLVFLGWVDRTFGLVFGAVKGILIVTVLFMMITTFVPDDIRFLKESRTAPYLAQVADVMSVFVSRGMKSDFYRHLKTFEFDPGPGQSQH